MAARDKERYYWLKLRRDFFKRHDVRVIENLPNGKENVLFLLKLMVESIDHEGKLRFSEEVPYTEEMLASVTDTEIDVVREGIKLFSELKIVQLQKNGTICLPMVTKMIGSETYSAERQRSLREKTTRGDNVARMSPVCRQEIEIEKELEKELEIESESELESEIELGSESETETRTLYTEPDRVGSTVPGGTVCRAKDARRIMEAWNSLGLQQLVRLTGSSIRGSMLKARIREHGVDGVLRAIEKVRESAFLCGQNAKGWVITFEWFVRPNNFLKVLGGNYDGLRNATEETANPFLSMMLEEADG